MTTYPKNTATIWSSRVPTKSGEYWYLDYQYWRRPYGLVYCNLDYTKDGMIDVGIPSICKLQDNYGSWTPITYENGVMVCPPILEWIWHGNANKSKGQYVAQLGAFYDGDGVLFSYKQLHRDDREPSIVSRIDSYQLTVQVSETRNGRKWFLDPSLTQRKVFIDIEEYFVESSARNESEALASLLLKQRAANDDK